MFTKERESLASESESKTTCWDNWYTCFEILFLCF